MKTKKTVSKAVLKLVSEVNELISIAKDLENYVERKEGSTWPHLFDFNKPVIIKNQFVYIELKYIGESKIEKERYNFNSVEYWDKNNRSDLMYELG